MRRTHVMGDFRSGHGGGPRRGHADGWSPALKDYGHSGGQIDVIESARHLRRRSLNHDGYLGLRCVEEGQAHPGLVPFDIGRNWRTIPR